MDFRITLESLLVGVLLLPAVAVAQTPTTGCSYQECALRTTGGGWFSGPAIVRGRTGERVSKFDRSKDLEGLMSQNDSSAAYYELFARSDRHADRFGLLGGLLMLGGVVVQVAEGSNDFSAWGVGLYFGGIVIGIGSSAPRRRSISELQTAIWWYNSTLELNGGAWEGAWSSRTPDWRTPREHEQTSWWNAGGRR